LTSAAATQSQYPSANPSSRFGKPLSSNRTVLDTSGKSTRTAAIAPHMKLPALRRSKHTQAMKSAGLAHQAMFANVAGKIHPKASMLHAGHALQFPFEQIALNGRQQMKSATLSKKNVDVILDAVIRRALQLNQMSLCR